MTIPEFLERLRETPGPWKLWINGEICRAIDGACPVCAVADRGVCDYWSAAPMIHLSDADALRIALAADGDSFLGFDAGLRAQLLAATVGDSASPIPMDSTLAGEA